MCSEPTACIFRRWRSCNRAKATCHSPSFSQAPRLPKSELHCRAAAHARTEADAVRLHSLLDQVRQELHRHSPLGGLLASSHCGRGGHLASNSSSKAGHRPFDPCLTMFNACFRRFHRSEPRSNDEIRRCSMVFNAARASTGCGHETSVPLIPSCIQRAALAQASMVEAKT